MSQFLQPEWLDGDPGTWDLTLGKLAALPRQLSWFEYHVMLQVSYNDVERCDHDWGARYTQSG